MTLPLVDPKTGAPSQLKGTSGKPAMVPPVDGSAITPDNAAVYNPPLVITIWDATAKTIVVVPYGMAGDPQITYPTKPGMKIPVLVKKVLQSGTTAAVIRGQAAYIASGGATVFGHILTESGTGNILTEGSIPLELESGA